MVRKLLLFIITILFASVIYCETIELNFDRQGIFIEDSDNNQYIGYLNYNDINFDPENRTWISKIIIYEKYVILEMSYAYNVYGYSVYNNQNTTDYNYNLFDPLFTTHSHYFIGIYDNFIFLLDIGNSPTVRGFIIVDLNSGEKIYEGHYIFEIGLNLIEPYIFELFIGDYLTRYSDHDDTPILYIFFFDKYTINLKNGEMTNLDIRIGIIGE